MFTAIDYLLYALPALLVALWAQSRIWRAQAEGSRHSVSSGLSGAEAAVAVMKAAGLLRVAIEPVEGELSDHYDPARKILRLSPQTYTGRSLTAVGIAAHEAGHAIQEVARYPGLVVRNTIVPLAAIGSTVCWLVVTAGILIGLSRLVYWGIALFSLAVVLQAINLPVEFDASRRARRMLRSTGVINAQEEKLVGEVMTAAALTYLASTLTGVLVLRYYFRGSSKKRSGHRAPDR
jgi:Zn-dependent membrane protease YugP